VERGEWREMCRCVCRCVAPGQATMPTDRYAGPGRAALFSPSPYLLSCSLSVSLPPKSEQSVLPFACRPLYHTSERNREYPPLHPLSLVPVIAAAAAAGARGRGKAAQRPAAPAGLPPHDPPARRLRVHGRHDPRHEPRHDPRHDPPAGRGGDGRQRAAGGGGRGVGGRVGGGGGAGGAGAGMAGA
jgi:uncharacterized membrane protein YgcG